MEIHMNVSFPRIPCELLTLDIMDVSGDVQAGVMHGVNKVRLAPAAEGGYVIETKSMDLYVKAICCRATRRSTTQLWFSTTDHSF